MSLCFCRYGDVQYLAAQMTAMLCFVITGITMLADKRKQGSAVHTVSKWATHKANGAEKKMHKSER